MYSRRPDGRRERCKARKRGGGNNERKGGQTVAYIGVGRTNERKC